MTEELVQTCENCRYEDEDMEGTHCRHCIHNATEHFEPKEKEMNATEIRAKAIDEFAEALRKCSLGDWNYIPRSEIRRIAEQMKEGGSVCIVKKVCGK